MPSLGRWYDTHLCRVRVLRTFRTWLTRICVCHGWQNRRKKKELMRELAQGNVDALEKIGVGQVGGLGAAGHPLLNSIG